MNSQKIENLHVGSSFDDLLGEEAILEEVTAVAAKRVIAWQISDGMSSLNRLLDEEDTSLTLTTLISAATALGKKVKIELESV